jgi:hypothetical protein
MEIIGFAKIAIKAISWIFRISPAINVLNAEKKMRLFT